MYEIEGPSFFKIAERTGAFQGVIRARAEQEAQDRADRKGKSHTNSRSANRDVSTPSTGELAQMGLVDIG